MRYVVAPVTFLLILLVLPLTTSVQARVDRVEIDERTVVYDGETTGSHGRYELIRGRIYFSYDPAHPRNQSITDLALAPRDDRGRVTSWTEFVILQPTVVEMRRGIGMIEVVNRGRPAALRYFNDAPAEFADLSSDPDALGDLLLLRQGLTLMWLGWQWDVPRDDGRFRLHVPRAQAADGSPITGWVRSSWVVDDTLYTLPLGHRDHVAYRPVTFDHPDHRLTVRTGRNAPRETVPRSAWRFGRVEAPELDSLHRSRGAQNPADGEELSQPSRSADSTVNGAFRSVVPDSQHIAIPGGTTPGNIYELTYRAADPAVVGLGLAAIRDAVAYLKYDVRSVAPVDRVFGLGISQTGRFLRQYLYDGFNTTEDGRMAFDGMMVLTAGGGRGSFNHRFAQPSRDGHRYSAFFYPTDLFPFTSRTQTDEVAVKSDGVHAHLEDSTHAPRTMYINTGYEYYGRAASLIHTTPNGRYDVAPPETDRIYHLASTQHVPGALPDSSASTQPEFLTAHPVDTRTMYRALLVGMVNWLDHDTPPPPSAFPSMAGGTLVPIDQLDMPRPDGVQVPSVVHTAHRIDYGPAWDRRRVITRQPPLVGPAFGMRVPQVDSIGNERGGVRPVAVQAPLATLTPWRLRTGKPHPRELEDFYGGMIPLSVTEASRDMRGDPRPTVFDLYPARDAYQARVREAADRLIEAGFLLFEDRQDEIDRAMQLWDWLVEK